MPQSKTRRRKGRGEVVPPLNVLERVDSLLKEMLDIFKEKLELTDSEIEHWHHDLGPFSLAAIEYAFECHRRNGRFFPVYGQILDICISYEPQSATPQTLCDSVCKSRHGKGYGENKARGWHDVTLLNEIICRKIQAEKRTVEQPLSDEEIEECLQELDRMRGSAPEWRKTA